MSRLSVRLGEVTLKNPIMPSSGTFGFGEDHEEIFDLNILGAMVTKATTLEPRTGNKTPRLAEVNGGLIISIGLQNPGSEIVVNQKLPYLEKYDVPVIANVAGSEIEDYVETVKKVSSAPNVAIIELNVSCPNVKRGQAIGTDKVLLKEIIEKVKEVSKKPVFVKLSPNVTNIVELAKTCEEAKADGITLINCLTGMKIDLKTKKPVIANKIGGFSGPAIKPVAMRMVYECYKNISIPIIAVGGISNAEDVLEYFLAGASAVQIGSMNLVNPYICKEIIEELPNVLDKYGFDKITDAIGYAHKE